MGNYASSCLKNQNKRESIVNNKIITSQGSQSSNEKKRPSIQLDKAPNPRDGMKDQYLPKRFLENGYSSSVALIQLKNASQDDLQILKIFDKRHFEDQNIQTSGYVHFKNQFLAETYLLTENQKKMFLIMEYFEPGDLSYYINQQKHFDEQTIRNIGAEVLLGLKFFEKYKIIYGKLRPQNILVTSNGHIKLSDFEFVKQNTQTLSSYKYRGLVEYTAPEILDNPTYNSKIDIWAFGILLYEMMHGHTPFAKNFEDQTIMSIRQGVFPINEDCSTEFKNIIKRLITADPQKRLSIDEIKQHAFFAKIDWGAVEERLNVSDLQSIILKYNTRYQRAHLLRKKRMYLTPIEPPSNFQMCIVINQ